MEWGALKPDGERFLPQFRGRIELEHYHRYFLARSLVEAKDVLDIASGEGFGSEILSRRARSVVGVDISPEAVAHASAHYVRENLRFLQGSATEIPLPDHSIDVIVSFETIEHLVEHDAMMSELKRVLRADGCLIISSPNKLTYTDRANYKNPFHLRELYTADFLRLTSQHFIHTRHYGQRVMTGSVIATAEAAEPFSTYSPADLSQGVADQIYDIILASDVRLPELSASIFEQPHGPLQPQKMEALVHEVETKSQAIARLENEVVRLGEQASAMQSSFNKAMSRGWKIPRDKWWRRTKFLWKLSNKIRKWKGKAPKPWTGNIAPEGYLEIHGVDARAPRGQLAARIDGDSPNIRRVKYSDVSEAFVDYAPAAPMKTLPKAIAFYLPQFHPFPENDAWWGKGFTEWTNVGKARPMFQGHHQPHCPIHQGYYDLRVPEVMEEQAKLAREYGISGFAYYFYWFAGKVLMDLPLQQMLGNPKVDMPFCMIWANEDWTRRWDGQENDVLISQKHSLEDSCALLDYLRPFMQDPRYIKVNGKPLFVIYRASLIPDMQETILAWRRKAQEFGFPGIYVVCAQSYENRDPRIHGFDAAMEFPPHKVKSTKISKNMDLLTSAFSGVIYCYDWVVRNAVMRENDDFKLFPAAMLSWDNTARKNTTSRVFANFSVVRYSQWLSANAERVTRDPRLSADEKLVFINAWNEWAEGAHLEPDQKHGYGYLAATRAVMENYVTEAAPYLQPKMPGSARSEIALIVHLHYEETWPELREAILRLSSSKPDVYVTVTSLHLANLVVADMPDAVIMLVDNRGRDIRPFLMLLERTQQLGYSVVAKVHGKASVYRSDGAKLRRSALDCLLSQAALDRILTDPKTGLLVPKASLLQHSNKNMHHNTRVETENLAKELGLDAWRGHFPAGSMFWFRPKALAPLLQMNVDSFDVERGLADGTRAHAVERLFCSVCEACGYEVGTV
jgi:lipopolysaccharide biosynthesis protein/ubiquinone/menaquinone biosynthesis C-methylase UbiE